MDANAKILARRYARAFMGLTGAPHGAAADEAARAKLEGLRRVFQAARPHLKALTHPVLNGAVRQEVLEKLLSKTDAGPAKGLAVLLVRRGRFGLLEDIMRECLAQYDVFRGVTRAEVYSRFALSQGELRRITDLLAGPEKRKIELRNIVAERVLGGFEIKIGDFLIDATLRGRLEALRASLRA